MNLFLFSTLALLLQRVSAQSTDGLLVSTQQGNVSGTFSTDTVRQFLGIPYASAPRWQPPAPPPNRTAVLNATAYSDSCNQMLTNQNSLFISYVWTFGIFRDIFVPMSEDCLSVNIWAPSLDRKQKTAVMIWVHGGDFNWGTSRLPVFDGTNIVRDNDDVILVSLNYRMNIFGQPNAPQLDLPSQPQNFGLLDIATAIQWVHDNIAAFGGDPNRITLFGQSAGAVAVDSYVLSHPNDTIIKAVIEQSGDSTIYRSTINVLDPQSVPRVNSTTWNSVALAVGCGSVPTADQFTCMQQIPATQLEDTVIKNNIAFNLVQDDITFFQDPLGRAAAGRFLHVPLLVGNTRYESDLPEIIQLLTHSTIYPITWELVTDILTTLTYTCASKNTTLAYLAGGALMFKYQYQAAFPNLSLRSELSRAYWGSDVPIVFGSYVQSPTPSTPDEIALSRYVQSVWVGFAKDPHAGLVNHFGWFGYKPEDATLAQLGNGNAPAGLVNTPSFEIEVMCQNEGFLKETLKGLRGFTAGF